MKHIGLVGTVQEQGRERIVGVGRYVASAKTPTQAEVAFAVDDDYQGRGVATLLLEHLTQIARAGGFVAFQADVLSQNKQMLEVFAHGGFVVRGLPEAGVVHLSLPLLAARDD